MSDIVGFFVWVQNHDRMCPQIIHDPEGLENEGIRGRVRAKHPISADALLVGLDGLAQLRPAPATEAA